MEYMTVRIDGADRRALIDALKQELGGVYVYTSDSIVILAAEEYYFRVKSNLMGVIILNFSEAGKCQADLISGGGGEGLLGITWGAEGSNNRHIAKFLKDLCGSNGWLYSEVNEQ